MKSYKNQRIMSESIYSLIQEKRKLFYTGIIRNTYKKQEENTFETTASTEVILPAKTKSHSFKSRSFHILQEIFSD